MNKQIVLSIQEIADLKECRKTLNQIIKTHDGTSITPVKNGINHFISEYGNSWFHHMGIYDNNGKELTHIKYDENEDKQFINDKIKLPTGKELHIMKCGGDTETAREFQKDENQKNRLLLHKGDIQSLLETDGEGGYKVRSVTVSGNNKETMTLLRNNKFNEENHQEVLKVTEDMNKDCHDYNIKFNKELYRNYYKLKEEWENNPNDNRTSSEALEYFRKEAYNQTVKNIGGDMYDFLNEKGYPQRYDNCNCKLRIRKNEDLTFNNPEDDDEYWEYAYPEDESFDEEYPIYDEDEYDY